MAGMKKRILSACVMVPALILIIMLPYANHLAFTILATIASLLGSLEMHALLSKDNTELSFLAYSGFLFPVSQYIQYSFFPESGLTFFVLMFIMGLVFTIEVFKGAKDDFKLTWERNCKTLLNVIYPGLFASFLVRISFLENAEAWLLLFFITVCGSDSFAYFIGMVFGRTNKGVVKVSPNKSVAGFLGGIICPAVISMLVVLLMPSTFPISPVGGFFLGFYTSLTGTCGDLIESSFKRSAGVKDSGTLIMGRGGVMDTIDSIVMAAPAYCAIVLFTLYI